MSDTDKGDTWVTACETLRTAALTLKRCRADEAMTRRHYFQLVDATQEASENFDRAYDSVRGLAIGLTEIPDVDA